MEERPTTELLTAVREGRPGALDDLLSRHQAQIYRFGLRMCGDRDDAQDVLQETLFAMARGVEDFRGASSLSTWLFSVARSFCIKKRRRTKSAPGVVDSLDTDASEEARRLADPSMSPEQALAARRIEEALDGAIGGLEPKYREVLVLRDIEGLTAPEVAEVLGISASAVKSRLHRARLFVRGALAPHLEDEAEPEEAAATEEKCPDIVALFSRHLEGEIGPKLCAEMERHVDLCPRCRRACDSLRASLAICRSASSAHVPRKVQEAVRSSLRDLS